MMTVERNVVVAQRALFEEIVKTFPTTLVSANKRTHEYVYQSIPVIEKVVKQIEDVDEAIATLIDERGSAGCLWPIQNHFLLGYNLAEVAEQSLNKDTGKIDYDLFRKKFMEIMATEIGDAKKPFIDMLCEYDAHYKKAVAAFEYMKSDHELHQYMDEGWLATMKQLNEVIQKSALISKASDLNESIRKTSSRKQSLDL